MPSSHAAEVRDHSFHCDCGDEMRYACEGEPFYKEHKGKNYCVLHFPGDKDSSKFNQALKWKADVKNFNFQGVWFAEEISFKSRYFDERVSFRNARFSKKADFTEVTFNDKADFQSATFVADVTFGYSTFMLMADFRYANFGPNTAFNYMSFNSDADFTGAVFRGHISFDRATFKGYIKFSNRRVWEECFGKGAKLSLRFSNIEKPDRVSFHSLSLKPHWFVGVDARKFEFINVNWQDIKPEAKSLVRLGDLSVFRVLAVTYRNLAVNAEENHRYEEASNFRYIAMDIQRLERWRGFAFWTLGWWFWLASGYGERVWRAFVALIGIWLLAAALYTQVGFARWEPRVATEKEAAEAQRDDVGQSLRWPRALTYSLGVMTLQKPEPRPATNAAQSLVMLETILGPVQAALLALAIRRKFMR